MKKMKLYNTAKVVMAALALGAMATACSDWDDHYDANSSFEGSDNATLWQNISANENLSEFAALAKKAGYDQVLNSTQTYTVWAPLNGTFNYEELNNMDVETLKKQFLQNHISHFNYPASGSLDQKVFMINEKLNMFTGNGTYKMGDANLTQANILNSNGTLHVIDGKLNFGFNIYETLSDTSYPIDSISAYFAKYNRKELDVDNSVKGPVVDGQITYLDSVMTEYNYMSNLLGAYINREDSNYTMILPTNEAWQEKKQMIDANINYLPKYTYYLNFPQNLNKADSTNLPREMVIDNAYLADSLSHLLMVRDLVFNNNIYDNGKLKNLQPGENLVVDSLVATSGMKLFGDDPAQLFKDAQRIERSNGSVWVTNKIGYQPWAYKMPVKIDAEYSNFRANTFGGTATMVTVNAVNKNPEVEGTLSDNAYCEVAGELTALPEVDYYLPQIYKGKYVLYLGIVPDNINVNTYNPKKLPNKIQVAYGYYDISKTNPGKYTEKNVTGTFNNDPSKIDTLRIGEIDFPTSTAGLSNAYPYIRIKSRASNREVAENVYDRTLRIDFILLVPSELDEYLKEHPDYKYLYYSY